MRYIFNFPDIGEGLEEGTINEWLVQKGQKIQVGDPLVNMETDKVAADIPSPKNGTIVALFGNVGDTILVGSPLVEIEIDEKSENLTNHSTSKISAENINEEGAGVVGTLEVASGNAYLPASSETVIEKKSTSKVKKILSTPVARAYAKDLGIDINNVKGTGPNGRVTKKDILEYSEIDTSINLSNNSTNTSTSDKNRVELIPLTQIRKTIAKNMSESKHNAVHMTVFDEVEISELIRIRNNFKEQYKSKGTKLSFMPFILKAVSMALKKYKNLNAQLDLQNNRIIQNNFVNIGIAVDTDYGLVVPVINDVDKLSIFEIALQVQELAKNAKAKQLNIDDMKNGTFTITNYGAIGGQFAVPVINYPQSAILGIGRLMQKPIVKNNEIIVGNILPLSLSVDHRIVDGGDTARFLNQIMNYIADPINLIME